MPRERVCQGRYGRPPYPCPDPARRDRCNPIASAGDVRECRLDDPEGPRVVHWRAQVGAALLAAGIRDELARTRQLFDLAVRAGDDEEVGRWFVQAAFDANLDVRRMTIAAIVSFAVHVRRRRADARAILLEVQRHFDDPRLAAGLAELAALDTTLFASLLHGDPEARTALLAEWAADHLAGRPLREPELRHLVGHVHAGRRGERLLRQILRARSTDRLRGLLRRLHRHRRGRAALTELHALGLEDRASLDSWHDDDRWRDDDGPHDDHHRDEADGWPVAVLTPAQQAALAVLQDLTDAPWPAHLGDRLSFTQRLALALRHPDADSRDVLAARRLADPAPLRSLAELELLALARRADPQLTHDLEPAAVLADLRACPDDGDLRLRCEALRLLAADPCVARSLVAVLPDLPRGLRPLAQLAALRPERADPPFADPGPLEWLLRSDLAAALVQHEPHIRWDLHDSEWRRQLVRRAARDVLRGGAGSLRRMDYPAFTLACRASLSVVRPEHLGELRAIGDELARLQAGLASDDPHALLAAIDGVAGHAAAITDLPALVEHACAYATLRAEILDMAHIRAAHIRRFADRRHELAAPPPTTLAELRARFGEARLVEGLAHAMLTFARDPPTPGAQRAAQRRVWTHRLRLLATLHELPPAPVAAADDEPEDTARALVEHLVRALEHAPLELAQALHLPPTQGLPKLGGVAAPLELRLRHLLRRGLRLADQGDGEVTRIRLRPLTKRDALLRGELGRDCSSRYVPLRCLSPHHTYYGLFVGDEQRPGYVTVFEAFARREGGARLPVLVLETVNVADGALDGVHQDLLVLLDAIAASRGLAGLAVVTGTGTWNYPNQRLVTACRRHRQGAEVRLQPADAAQWRAFEVLSGEAGHYCAFRSPRTFRLLAAFDRARDLVQPENAAEAARLRASPPRDLLVTARDAAGQPAAFISQQPALE